MSALGKARKATKGLDRKGFQQSRDRRLPSGCIAAAQTPGYEKTLIIITQIVCCPDWCATEMGDAWSGNSGMDPYAALEPTWSGLGNYGLSSGVQARPQQHRGYGTAGAGQAAGPSNATLPELDDDFIDCLLANLQVPALPQQQLHNQGQQQQQQQQQRAPDQQQLRHLHVLPSALGAATGEAERADPESEARYTMASSDDIEPTPTIARLKERNRKAQRAFRARQKARPQGAAVTIIAYNASC